MLLYNELSRYLSNESNDRAYSYEALQTHDMQHAYRFLPCRDELAHLTHDGDVAFSPETLCTNDPATSHNDYFAYYGAALAHTPVADRNLKQTYELLLEWIARDFQRAYDALCGCCPVVQAILEKYSSVILFWAALHNGGLIRFDELLPTLATKFAQFAFKPSPDTYILFWIHPNRHTIGWSVATPTNNSIVFDTLHNRFVTRSRLFARPFYPTTIAISRFLDSPTYYNDIAAHRALYVEYLEHVAPSTVVKQLSFASFYQREQQSFSATATFKPRDALAVLHDYGELTRSTRALCLLAHFATWLTTQHYDRIVDILLPRMPSPSTSTASNNSIIAASDEQRARFARFILTLSAPLAHVKIAYESVPIKKGSILLGEISNFPDSFVIVDDHQNVHEPDVAVQLGYVSQARVDLVTTWLEQQATMLGTFISQIRKGQLEGFNAYATNFMDLHSRPTDAKVPMWQPNAARSTTKTE